MHNIATRWRRPRTRPKMSNICPPAPPKIGGRPQFDKNAMRAICLATNPENFVKNLRPFSRYRSPEKIQKLHFLELGEFWFRKNFFEDVDCCCPCIAQISSGFAKNARWYGRLKFSVPLTVMVRKNLKGCKIFSGTDIKNLSVWKLRTVAIYGRAKFHDDKTTFTIF